MLVIEYKIKAKPTQYKAIDEAIRTVQFIRNKCDKTLDGRTQRRQNQPVCFEQIFDRTTQRVQAFVKDLNSMAVQAAAERGWLAISRFYNRLCKV
jgi:putative transposase